MVTLELRIYQILKTFSGNGVVIIFVPDTVVRSWNLSLFASYLSHINKGLFD